MRFLWLLLVCSSAFAEKASVKVKDIDTDKDTAILIKKDYKASECTEFQIIDGNEEVFGTAEFDKAKAYQSWKDGCKEWKDTLKDLNKDNRIVTLNCGAPKVTQESDNKYSYQSSAAYKIRVKIREKGEAK